MTASTSGTPQEDPAATAACRILIVDDESLIRMDLRLVLEEAGYTNIEEAANVEGALSLARQWRPDVAILDINLAGDTEGFTLAQALRKMLPTRIIFVTGYGTDETRRAAAAFLPVAFLNKPFDSVQVLAAVAHGCRGPRERNGVAS